MQVLKASSFDMNLERLKGHDKVWKLQSIYNYIRSPKSIIPTKLGLLEENQGLFLLFNIFFLYSQQVLVMSRYYVLTLSQPFFLQIIAQYPMSSLGLSWKLYMMQGYHTR
jgi:hypothetical protein